MSESDFFQRAVRDPAFCRAQLDDLRYLKNVGAGLMWFCAALGAAASLYGGLVEGKWELGLILLMLAALTATTHSWCLTRLAALEVLEQNRAASHGV
jgi:hypothetical protein